MSIVPITSSDLKTSEVSWFSALCSDDYQFLGVPEGTFAPAGPIVLKLLKRLRIKDFATSFVPPHIRSVRTHYHLLLVVRQLLTKINLLAAVRCGEMQPIMLARTLATLDHMLEGRLTVNIISSDFPGQKEPGPYRYQRSREVVEILKQAWTQDEINYSGDIYNFEALNTDPAQPYQNGGPLLYFGGIHRCFGALRSTL